MPKPTGRVLALLELLQAGGTRTAADLAERLGVDERTTRRYIQHLTELEIPVEAVRGRYGGYRIGAGYRLPPLMLTDGEAVAASLGLAAVARTGPSAEVRLGAESASAKIRRVLPRLLAERLEALLGTRSTEPARAPSAVAVAVLLTAASAARDGRPLRIRHSGRTGRLSERTVLPWGVIEHGARWYLIGPDSASGRVRTFRLDRVETVEVAEGRFQVPPDFDAATHLLTSLARTPRDHEVVVRIRAPLARVRERLPVGIAVLQVMDADPGWVQVELQAQHLTWVAGVLALLDAPFRIDRPEELRHEVLALAERLHDRASAPSSSPTAA